VPQGSLHALQVCADRNKPDGQYVLAATLDAVNHFVSELPIRKVPGIGKVLESTDDVVQSVTVKDLVSAVKDTSEAVSYTVM
jgi:nucleotidyltransferase/DNA polymerase involved in DNA repair